EPHWQKRSEATKSESRSRGEIKANVQGPRTSKTSAYSSSSGLATADSLECETKDSTTSKCDCARSSKADPLPRSDLGIPFGVLPMGFDQVHVDCTQNVMDVLHLSQDGCVVNVQLVHHGLGVLRDFEL